MTDVDLNAGVLAPVGDEVHIIEGITVEGRIPDAVNGMLMRNGPNPYDRWFSGGSMLDWWTGPAMVHGLAIDDGRIGWYRNRWINPPPSGGGPAPRWANTNVNVISFAGSILALGEGAPPVRIGPDLEPLGPTTFGGRLPAGMMAHPKIDPATGELRFFRADWQPPFLRVGAIDSDGLVTELREVDIAKPMMMHDFAVTNRFDIVLDLNVGLDLTLVELGLPLPLRWIDDHRSRLGAVPRDGTEPTWFDIEPCFIQHVVNGYELPGDRLVLDAVRYPDFLRFDPERSRHLPNPLGVLWRYELDLANASVVESQLDDMAIELPRIDERHTGRPHDCLFAVEQPSDREMRGLRRYDLAAGTHQRFQVDPGDQNSEAVFVPGGSAEGDGWLLSCVYRAASDTTDVVMLTAHDLAAPPQAVIRLPRRLPAGFHGSWVPAGGSA